VDNEVRERAEEEGLRKRKTGYLFPLFLDEKTKEGERLCFFILLFLDEKKQKSSDYRIS
jgi:hypothetical protein